MPPENPDPARRPLVHVGYHKTATSWLQQRLFLPGNGYGPIARHEEVDRLLVRPHGLDWDPGPLRAHLAREAAALAPGLVPVVSSELMSGNPFHAGAGSDVHARRLRDVAPRARILVSVRSQRRILPSLYMQYLSRGGTEPPEAFFAGQPEPGYLGFSPEHFEYDRLVALYQGLFGRDAVLVIQQEALARDADALAARVAAFAGARFTGLGPGARERWAPSYPEHAAPLLRAVNRVQRSLLNPRPAVVLGRTPHGLYRLAGAAARRAPRALWARRRPVSAVADRLFAGRYGPSNARLAALVADGPSGPLDLAGYDRPEDAPGAAPPGGGRPDGPGKGPGEPSEREPGGGPAPRERRAAGIR